MTARLQQMISVDRAREILREVARAPQEEKIPVLQAVGRRLARPVRATGPYPAFPRAAMDGYAVRARDLGPSRSTRGGVRLRLVGLARAGSPYQGKVDSGQAVRITTGAPLPAGADAVIRQERVLEEGEWILPKGTVSPGQDVSPVGEDIRAGQRLLSPGSLLRGQELGLLSLLGLQEVSVWRRPRVGVLVTGSEVARPGSPLAEGQIHDATGPAILGRLIEWGCTPVDLGQVPDDPETLLSRLEAVPQSLDLLILTGGASVGPYDLTREVLSRWGAEPLFWRVAMKPGKAVVAGQKGDLPVIGLSGNPAAALISFEVLLTPLLARMTGRPEPRWTSVRLLEEVSGKPGAVRFFRAGLSLQGGRLWARPLAAQGATVLSSLVEAQALVRVEPGQRLKTGARVPALLQEPFVLPEFAALPQTSALPQLLTLPGLPADRETLTKTSLPDAPGFSRAGTHPGRLAEGGSPL